MSSLRRCCLASMPKLAERLRRTSKANPEAGAVSPPSVFSEHMLLRGEATQVLPP